jgi:hypothetical protein
MTQPLPRLRSHTLRKKLCDVTNTNTIRDECLTHAKQGRANVKRRCQEFDTQLGSEAAVLGPVVLL